MKIEGSHCRNFVALILVLVLGLTMAVSGHAASAPAEPDPETLSRLKWAETSGGEALLIGTNIEVGKERPERIFPPIVLFARDTARAVSIRQLSVTGPDGKVRVSARPGKRLETVGDIAKSRAEAIHEVDRRTVVRHLLRGQDGVRQDQRHGLLTRMV